MRRRAYRYLAIFAALLSLHGCGESVPDDIGAGKEVTVSRVTDGDTVEIRPALDGTRDVRLIGVDAPETAYSPRGPQPYGEEAAEFAGERLEGGRVTLRFDVERKDRYGRLLAYLYLPDGSMFNEVLLREGYAQVATFPPNVRHVQRFREAQREAREARRGIWGLPESRLCRLTDRGNGIGGGCRGKTEGVESAA
jgi:micrococcal nuclease